MFNLLLLAAGCYLFYLWWTDTQSNLKTSNLEITAEAKLTTKGMIPGAYYSSYLACIIATLGAIAIILFVTFLEFKFGISEEQSDISWWFIAAMLGAAITEEVVFRGYLIVRNRGATIAVLSAVGFSFLFAIVHPYLWTHHIETPSGLQWISSLNLELTTQTILATASIFVLSLWFYWVRFWPLNPSRSLLPCFFAHAGANLAVYIVKLMTGHVA